MSRDNLQNVIFVNNVYDRERKRFERAVRLVKNTLKDFFDDIKDESVHYLTSRVKAKDSILRKLEKKEYKNIFYDMKDIAGIRIVCHNESDIEAMITFITRCFPVLENEKVDRKDGYKATHLVINVKVPMSGLVVDTKVEIQIRTIAQDLFATLSHRDIYKLSVDLPDSWIIKMKKLGDILDGVDKLAQELKDEWIVENSEKIMKDQLSVQTIVRLCKAKVNKELTITDATNILINLITFEIRKISELEKILSDLKIKGVLAKKYSEFLNREPFISELCFYGGLLYKYGVNEFNLSVIDSGIKASKEYLSKHGMVLGRLRDIKMYDT